MYIDTKQGVFLFPIVFFFFFLTFLFQKLEARSIIVCYVCRKQLSNLLYKIEMTHLFVKLSIEIKKQIRIHFYLIFNHIYYKASNFFVYCATCAIVFLAVFLYLVAPAQAQQFLLPLLIFFSIFQHLWTYLKLGSCTVMSLQFLLDFIFIGKFNNMHPVFYSPCH